MAVNIAFVSCCQIPMPLPPAKPNQSQAVLPSPHMAELGPAHSLRLCMAELLPPPPPFAAELGLGCPRPSSPAVTWVSAVPASGTTSGSLAGSGP